MRMRIPRMWAHPAGQRDRRAAEQRDELAPSHVEHAASSSGATAIVHQSRLLRLSRFASGGSRSSRQGRFRPGGRTGAIGDKQRFEASHPSDAKRPEAATLNPAAAVRWRVFDKGSRTGHVAVELVKPNTSCRRECVCKNRDFASHRMSV